jgi:hypothetical protein
VEIENHENRDKGPTERTYNYSIFEKIVDIHCWLFLTIGKLREKANNEYRQFFQILNNYKFAQ